MPQKDDRLSASYLRERAREVREKAAEMRDGAAKSLRKLARIYDSMAERAGKGESPGRKSGPDP